MSPRPHWYNPLQRVVANGLVVLGTDYVVPGYEGKIWVSLDYSNIPASFVAGLTAKNGDTALMQRIGSGSSGTWLVVGIQVAADS